MDEMTLCPKCKHYLSIDDGPRTGIWYNLYCKAVAKEPAIDPTTGKQCFTGINDFGNTYITEEKYFNYRDLNNGDCEYYESKKHKCKKFKPDVFDKIKDYLTD